jgi:hypothetical protein
MSEDFFSDIFKSILPLLKWVLIGLFIFYFLFSDKRKGNKIPDIKSRMWRKFQYVHAELFPHLADHEKREMISVLNTTVANASLFKDTPNRSNSESAKKKTHKKVSFHNEMVSHRHYY